MTCWCADVAAGRGAASTEELAGWLRDGLERGASLGSTTQHFADVTEHRCRHCAWPVIQLLIEHEGFSGSLHHYFVPTLALPAPTEDYEAWAAARPGVHVIGGRPSIYRRARIGYVGLGAMIVE